MSEPLSARARRLRRTVDAFKAAGGRSGGGEFVRVTITDDDTGGTRGFDRVFAGLGVTLDGMATVLATEGLRAVRAEHLKVFETQGRNGRGAWAELAPRTRAERARLGYGATGPILQRTGALRRHVLSAPGRVTRSGNVVELRIAPDRVVGGVPKYAALAKGNPATNLPARPMVALGPAASNRVTSAISRALRRRAASAGLPIR